MQVFEHELFLGFLYNPAAQSATQLLLPTLITKPVEHVDSQAPVNGSAYVLAGHTSTHFLAVLSIKLPVHF